jgi:zinc transporter ZupT
MLTFLVLVVHLVPAASSADDHAGHGHGGADKFEWAGVFATPESSYMWTAQKGKTSKKYADATMKMTVLPASAATDAALHALEKEGNHGLEMTCTDVQAGGTITPKEDACYKLVFKQDWWQSLYTINTAGIANVAFFTEHFPTEFENTAHYLKDDHGDDIEPVAQLPEPKAETAAATVEREKHWGPAILTSVIVNVVTLCGAIFMVPVFTRGAKNYAAEFELLTSGFAAGAISACAFFLLLFEATHLIGVDHKKEVDSLWRWGTMILAGILFPAVVHPLAELLVKKPVPEKNAEASDAEKVEGQIEIAMAPNPAVRARLISSVLFGDFMHNLCDGFFLGAAFSGCGTSFGWNVAIGTIAHELAQELSDYVVLTGKDCQLKPIVALLLNFLSGTGVLLGTVIVLSTEVGNGDIGLLLAFGGGTYLYIALVECMPKLGNVAVGAGVRSLGVLMFILGAIVIGLVLLDHEHCVPPALPGQPAVDPHAGHNH